jgi:hypothetical protein
MVLRFLVLIIALFILILGSVYSANAQVQVDFFTNIEEVLGGNEFVAETDKVELIISSNSLRFGTPILMENVDKKSNVFGKTVDFPFNMKGNNVNYKFRVTLKGTVHNEDLQRVIKVAESASTDTLYFNTYIW